MELNAKIASLEDEVKLLKGEVKLILSEIRTAILGQDNPFSEPGQALRMEPSVPDSRPPIKVVRVSNEEAEVAEPEPEVAASLPDDVWQDEMEAPTQEPVAMEKPPEVRKVEEPPPAVEPAMTYPAPPPLVPPPQPIAIRPVVSAAAPARPAEKPHWSLITVAGLAVWAEEAVKQIGIKRLRVLLDLCEYTGDLSADSKEALLKVTSLVHVSLERKTPPSTNECLVVLCQLDALLKGDQPAGLSLPSLPDKWQKTA
ncbi:MAG: hypothetical protein ABSC13_04015 [Dehalococcoidia bacterium]|jgi:hypothetical protein